MNIFFILISLYSFNISNLPHFHKATPSNFYVGTESFITIEMNNCDPEDINVRISSGYINRRNDSTFTFYPQVEGDEVKLKLYYKKVICEVKTITVKNLPNIIPFFEVESQGKIKKSDLSKIGKLTQNYPNDFPADMIAEIYSFNVIMISETGINLYANTVFGNTFDPAAMQKLIKLNKGSKIIINNILLQSKYRGVSRLQIQKDLTVIE